MRFQSGFAARAERVAMETRAIERPAGVQQVLAPAGWPDVRIEAWLDWVEAEGFATPLSGDWLSGGVDAWAERLAETGVTEGVFDRAEAAAFVEELSGAFRLGLAGPAASGPAATGVVDLNDPGAAARLNRRSRKKHRTKWPPSYRASSVPAGSRRPLAAMSFPSYCWLR